MPIEAINKVSETAYFGDTICHTAATPPAATASVLRVLLSLLCHLHVRAVATLPSQKAETDWCSGTTQK